MRAHRLTLWTVVWRHLWWQPWMTALNLVLLSLGFAIWTGVLLVSHQAERIFERDLAGIDLVVGSKGSPLQLMLSAVFHVDVPTGNIPAQVQADLEKNPLVSQVLPLGLGDSVHGYRIVGTTASALQFYGLTLAAGQWGGKPMQVVLGASVARELGWAVGHHFHGSHGLGADGPAHADQAFEVVGILAPTGLVMDRLVLTPLASVWALHAPHDGMHDDHDEAERQVTALLVRYRSPLAAVSVPRWVQAQPDLQAASPAMEAARLFNLLGVGLSVLQGFATMVLGLSALSVFMTLSQRVMARQQEMATLRVLGASPRRIASLVILEALVLTSIGVLLGMSLGHLLVQLLPWMAASSADMAGRFSGLRWVASEVWLPLAAMAMALFASAWPTWMAYRRNL